MDFFTLHFLLLSDWTASDLSADPDFDVYMELQQE